MPANNIDEKALNASVSELSDKLDKKITEYNKKLDEYRDMIVKQAGAESVIALRDSIDEKYTHARNMLEFLSTQGCYMEELTEGWAPEMSPLFPGWRNDFKSFLDSPVSKHTSAPERTPKEYREMSMRDLFMCELMEGPPKPTQFKPHGTRDIAREIYAITEELDKLQPQLLALAHPSSPTSPKQ